ncbi:hypothetical protein B9Q19_02020 [Enterobacter bugandensis]|nr:hypothetical protein B9Q19_02020 [Enterobacter bugandensis]
MNGQVFRLEGMVSQRKQSLKHFIYTIIIWMKKLRDKQIFTLTLVILQKQRSQNNESLAFYIIANFNSNPCRLKLWSVEY